MNKKMLVMKSTKLVDQTILNSAGIRNSKGMRVSANWISRHTEQEFVFSINRETRLRS